MRFRVQVLGRAERHMDTLRIRKRVEAAYDALATDPFRPRPGADIKKLRAETGQYRLRIGHYRVLYLVIGDTVTITGVYNRSQAPC